MAEKDIWGTQNFLLAQMSDAQYLDRALTTERALFSF
jgi:hypothetical protein